MAWTSRTGALVLGLLLGTFVTWRALQPPAPQASATGWIDQIREVARLETLDISLHKKIVFAPEPSALTGSWRDVWEWASRTLNPREGKVIVFAVAHLGVDLHALGAEAFLAQGREAYVVLPQLQAQIELSPGETEVIGSNLDTEQTMALLERARGAFEQEVLADPKLQARATVAAQRAVADLLRQAGFAKIHFVNTLPSGGAS